MHFNGGLVVNCSLTKERVAPESTNMDTLVSFTIPLMIRRRWSWTVGPESDPLSAMGSTGTSLLSVMHLGPPANSDRKLFALRGAPTACALEVLCLSAWHRWQRRHLATLRLHFLDLNWRFCCLMLPRLMMFVQFLWLNWTRCPGCDPDWPESGPVSFPACPEIGRASCRERV